MGLEEEQERHTDEGVFLERVEDLKGSIIQIGLLDSGDDFRRLINLLLKEFKEGDIKIIYDHNKPEQLVISFDKFATSG